MNAHKATKLGKGIESMSEKELCSATLNPSTSRNPESPMRRLVRKISSNSIRCVSPRRRTQLRRHFSFSEMEQTTSNRENASSCSQTYDESAVSTGSRFRGALRKATSLRCMCMVETAAVDTTTVHSAARSLSLSPKRRSRVQKQNTAGFLVSPSPEPSEVSESTEVSNLVPSNINPKNDKYLNQSTHTPIRSRRLHKQVSERNIASNLTRASKNELHSGCTTPMLMNRKTVSSNWEELIDRFDKIIDNVTIGEKEKELPIKT
jgi:hypothetical protein